MPLPSDLELHTVESIDDAWELKRWLGERRDVMGLDTETSGLNPYAPDARLRTVQIGDTKAGWLIPWERWGGVALEALNAWDGVFAVHNLAFDEKWLRIHAGWKVPWDRTHDTMIMANMLRPGAPAGLKNITDQFIDPRASLGDKMLKDAFKTNGWDWNTVPLDYPAFAMYSALDPVLAAYIWEYFRADLKFPKSFDLEMNTLRICAGMEDRGVPVDVEYCLKQQKALEEYVESSKKWGQDNLGINIGSNIQLAKYFEDTLNAEITKRTAGGSPSMDKEVLKAFATGSDPKVAEFAKFVLEVRKAEKIKSSYIDNFLRDQTDGILHSNIKTLRAVTGRMCIPDSHLLLTPSGPKLPEVGDKTLDKDGNWTEVTAVHRYSDAQVFDWGRGLASTAEHRWVWRYEDRQLEHVSPTSAGKRHVLRLAPVGDFDFSDTELSPTTDGEKFAALIGMLITDGNCKDYAAGTGLRATVYQTEKKFYNELVSAIPEDAVMYDSSRSYGSDGTIHEIRIKSRWLRPRLTEAGICPTAGVHLKDNPALIPWISSLPINELNAFMSAAFLADGTTSVKNHKTITSQSANSRVVLQIAGYRLGWSSSQVTCGAGGFTDKVRYAVRFRKALMHLRNVNESTYETDVWCVSTESGTFTAWNGAPYLTGNSITNPALQTLGKNDTIVRNAIIPRQGQKIISSDLDQVEFRVFAHLSEDEALINTFLRADETGSDAFTEIGRQIYEPDFQKSDKRRTYVKNVVYGKLYGSGVAKMAQAAGVPKQTMQDVNDALEAQYPGIKRYQKEMESEISRRLRQEGQPYINTVVTGRRIPVEEERIYSGLNYTIQSSAAEVFKTNLSKIDAAGLGSLMMVPVHDEIVMSVPPEDCEEVMHTVGELMTTREGWAVPLTAGTDGPYDRWGSKYSE